MATETQITSHNKDVMEQRLLDMKQVQQRLHVGRSTAFGLVQSGQLRSVRIGRRRLVPVEALEQFLAELV